MIEAVSCFSVMALDCNDAGGAGGKGVWGKPGLELEETGACNDVHDPNYDSDSQVNSVKCKYFHINRFEHSCIHSYVFQATKCDWLIKRQQYFDSGYVDHLAGRLPYRTASRKYTYLFPFHAKRARVKVRVVV